MSSLILLILSVADKTLGSGLSHRNEGERRDFCELTIAEVKAQPSPILRQPRPRGQVGSGGGRTGRQGEESACISVPF